MNLAEFKTKLASAYGQVLRKERTAAELRTWIEACNRKWDLGLTQARIDLYVRCVDPELRAKPSKEE